MPDVPYPKPKEPTPSEIRVQRVRSAGEAVARSIRTLLTGDSDGRLRRPLLFVVAEVGVLAALVVDGIAGIAIGGIGMIALLLLAFTDNEVAS